MGNKLQEKAQKMDVVLLGYQMTLLFYSLGKQDLQKRRTPLWTNAISLRSHCLDSPVNQ